MGNLNKELVVEKKKVTDGTKIIVYCKDERKTYLSKV